MLVYLSKWSQTPQDENKIPKFLKIFDSFENFKTFYFSKTDFISGYSPNWTWIGAFERWSAGAYVERKSMVFEAKLQILEVIKITDFSNVIFFKVIFWTFLGPGFGSNLVSPKNAVSVQLSEMWSRRFDLHHFKF